MNPKEFDEFRDDLNRKCDKILGTKGIEYTQGDEDRLKNFKSSAKDLGISPMVVWSIYFMKHIDAIKTFVKKGKVFSDETIEGRFIDARNYLDLGLALITDMNIKYDDEHLTIRSDPKLTAEENLEVDQSLYEIGKGASPDEMNTCENGHVYHERFAVDTGCPLCPHTEILMNTCSKGHGYYSSQAWVNDDDCPECDKNKSKISNEDRTTHRREFVLRVEDANVYYYKLQDKVMGITHRFKNAFVFESREVSQEMANEIKEAGYDYPTFIPVAINKDHGINDNMATCSKGHRFYSESAFVSDIICPECNKDKSEEFNESNSRMVTCSKGHRFYLEDDTAFLSNDQCPDCNRKKIQNV